MTNTNQVDPFKEFIIYRLEALSKENRALHTALRILEKRLENLDEVTVELCSELDDVDKRIDYLDDHVSDIVEGDGRGW